MGACLIKASVGPDHDESTRKRLGAPAAATCAAPRRVDSGLALSAHCAVRLQGADNPLIHILSIAQLMEVNEAFNRFGAPCCVHPRSTAFQHSSHRSRPRFRAAGCRGDDNRGLRETGSGGRVRPSRLQVGAGGCTVGRRVCHRAFRQTAMGTGTSRPRS